tara:strand:- start:169 stop:2109 length:1941 start_codon:yes stop_codon:yes gene_type:complete
MSATNTSDDQAFLGQPKGLMTLFFSEMWERFCYYGMRTLLTLFLVKSLMMGDSEASLIYGAYCGLVYAAPILGGRMADNFLGYRYAVILGAVLMAIGEFLILGETKELLYIGMGAIIIGNGYFKANISTIVGKLYKDNDPRRDSGFTIFYIGINIGALLATTVVAYIGETYGFRYGFGLAGIGMLLGLVIFWAGRKNYATAPGVDIPESGKKKMLGPLSAVQTITLSSLLLIPLCYALIINNFLLNYIFLALFILIAYILVNSGIKEDKKTGESIWKDRMIALVIFMIINIVFWACFEQAGTSLTLFADRNIDRVIFGWEMPASMTQFFNPFFIILFGSLFSVMWVKLSKIGKNPNIPMKFAFGILQLGLGFLLTYVGFQLSTDNLVPLFVLILLYMLHTTGELFLSPIGLSMVTKLSPKNMAGTAMGAWFLSFAIANLLGGQIATLTGDGHGGGKENDKSKFSLETTVKEGFQLNDNEAGFESWMSLKDLPKNISYQKWFDIRDWVEMREGVSNNLTLAEFQNNRSIKDTLERADQWLSVDKWKDLDARYSSFLNEDSIASSNDGETGISQEDWSYYKGTIKELSEDKNGVTLSAAIDEMVSIKQKSALQKYIDVFTKIGAVLVFISLLIALVSRPIKKLMHGVE